MDVQRFVKWCATATNHQRIDSYLAIARAIAAGDLSPGDRARAVAALHGVLDEPSPVVREAVAAFAGRMREAPRSLLKGFLGDIDRIAVHVADSDALRGEDLLHAISFARPVVQIAIARRRAIDAAPASAIAWYGCMAACRALLQNEGAVVSADALRRLSDRFGADADIRAILIERADLPPDVRQVLVLETMRVLQASPFVTHALGGRRAAYVGIKASERATSVIAEMAQPRDLPAFVEHLRATGQISPAFLIRNACIGNVDLIAAILTRISGLPERRVRAVVVEGRKSAYLSLGRACELGETTVNLLRIAVTAWKEVARGHPTADFPDVQQDVMRRIIAAFASENGIASRRAAAMLSSLEEEVMRDAFRTEAHHLLAA